MEIHALIGRKKGGGGVGEMHFLLYPQCFQNLFFSAVWLEGFKTKEARVQIHFLSKEQINEPILLFRFLQMMYSAVLKYLMAACY